MVTHHEVKFEKNVVTGMHRATCSCGWVMLGTLEEVQSRAATHDTEWQEICPVIDPDPTFHEELLENTPPVVGKWSGPPGWRHEVGSAEYFTDDGRGKVIRSSDGFAMIYDAFVDGKWIGGKRQRGHAMTLVEKSK